MFLVSAAHGVREQKCCLQEMEKGERENIKPFPLSPYPFPDLCKKYIMPLSPDYNHLDYQSLQSKQQLDGMFAYMGERVGYEYVL